MKTWRLVTTYAFLALLAMAANILTQMLSMQCYRGQFAVTVSIVVGTGVGLVLKYALDKRYIFRFKTRDLGHDGALLLLYSTMGLATTVIFWGTEFAFQHIFETDAMRYAGGALGLSIGYVVKYQLDKRFVFVGGVQSQSGQAADAGTT
jgi:putative flippase GtrA